MPLLDQPTHLALTRTVLDQLNESVGSLLRPNIDPGDPGFSTPARHLASRLPDPLRRHLADFRTGSPSATSIISGLDVADDTLGPTPLTWAAAAAQTHTRHQELTLALTAANLGFLFGWPTLQNGRLVHHILPMQGHEHDQSGYGSVQLLLHNEDAFSATRCHYLLLLGLRNTERVATTVASARDVRLTTERRRLLGEPRFRIRPDGEHITQLQATDPTSTDLARILQLSEAPDPVPVLTGPPNRPQIRVDPPFMDCDDAKARDALHALIDELHRVEQPVILEPGTVAIIDNRAAVHGRGHIPAAIDPAARRWALRAQVR